MQSTCTNRSGLCISSREGAETKDWAHRDLSSLPAEVFETDQAGLPTETSVLMCNACKPLILLGGRTRARTWDPLIKRHATGIDFSKEFSQPGQNRDNRDQ